MHTEMSHRLSSDRISSPNLSLIRKPYFIIPFLVLCLVAGIGFVRDFPNIPRLLLSDPPAAQQAYLPSQVPTNDGVWGMIGQVNRERLLSDLRKLTGVDPVCLNNSCYTITNRSTGSVGLQWAQDYVHAQLTSLGYTVQVQDWTRNEISDQNLIVRKVGEVHPEDEIYFVAHMDGESSPAADDNASGTVDLLELARVISQRKFEKTIVLLFSSGEEQDVQGVKYYVEHLSPDQLAAINYVINLDMLGYDSNSDGVMELFNGSQPPDFVQLLAGIITGYHIGLTPEIYEDCG